MKKFLTGVFAAIVFISAAGAFCRTNAQTFSGSIGTIKRGKSAKGSITMTLPENLHVNSNKPTSEFAVPTVIKINAIGAKVGKIVYPRGTDKKFAFSEDAFNVYENRNRFDFVLKIPANFKGKIVRVNAVIKYQACTNEVCYPPAQKKIAFTANVQSRNRLRKRAAQT